MSDDRYPTSPAPDASADEVDQFLEAVLFHYILRCEGGAPPDPDVYLARYPKYAEALAMMIAGGVDAPIVYDNPGTATRERRRGWNLKTIGGYEIQFLAASTGSSHVYKALDPRTSEIVALKVHRRDQQVDPSEVERFKREGEILEELNFAGVIPLIDVGEDEGSLFVVMPWIEGITLLETIDILSGTRQPGQIDPGPLSPKEKAQIILDVATSLVKVHEHGILHRDLKPSNIMLNAEGAPVLIDFGIARKEGTNGLTLTGDQAQGTPRYLAPEVLHGEVLRTTTQGEVYALGLTFYELLVERPAYNVDNRQELFEAVLLGPPCDPRKIHRHIPKAIAHVVTQAIDHDVRRRYQSMSEFAEDLKAAMESSQSLRSTRSLPLLLIATTLVVAMILYVLLKA